MDIEHIKAATEYDASQIQVLEGLEAVRKRPGMYIGTTSFKGLHHLVYEIVDNAIDEALAGFCNEISVTIEEGEVICGADNGRGIPVGIQEQTGKSALEVVYTILHAGGKFGGGGYKVAGGLHGVGASVVNALSEWLVAEVCDGETVWQMKFSRGRVTQSLTEIGKTTKRGTKIRFKPDPEIFEETVFSFETLYNRLREQAFLNAGLKIILEDRRQGKEEKKILLYEGGIRSFITEINKNKTTLHDNVIYIFGEKGDSVAEIAMQYTDSYNEIILSFANNISTTEGGMHETGFKAALTRVINDYGKKYNILKGEDKLSGEDTREGLTAIISVKLVDAQFEGQTKTKLGNSEIRTLVDSIVSEKLGAYFEKTRARQKLYWTRPCLPHAPEKRPRRPATLPGAKAPWRALRFPASSPTAMRETRR
jgi:DNA gyrase subunit B